VTTRPPGSDPEALTLHDATATLPGSSGNGPPTDATDTPSAADTPPSRRSRTKRMLIEWVVLIVAALAIAFLIKTFLFQAFYIPSGSMEPTLMIGDRVLVNKLSYDFHDVHRGDIIVFVAPKSAQSDGITDLVKRVIGLPGETVTGRPDGDVYVNGRRLNEPYLPKDTPTTFSSVPPFCGRPPDGNPGCVVPPGRLLVLGDNRTESKDGRFFGSIPESSIVGRVFIKIWPLGSIGFM
jgi:signal peptidase I